MLSPYCSTEAASDINGELCECALCICTLWAGNIIYLCIFKQQHIFMITAWDTEATNEADSAAIEISVCIDLSPLYFFMSIVTWNAFHYMSPEIICHLKSFLHSRVYYNAVLLRFKENLHLIWQDLEKVLQHEKRFAEVFLYENYKDSNLINCDLLRTASLKQARVTKT